MDNRLRSDWTFNWNFLSFVRKGWFFVSHVNKISTPSEIFRSYCSSSQTCFVHKNFKHGFFGFSSGFCNQQMSLTYQTIRNIICFLEFLVFSRNLSVHVTINYTLEYDRQVVGITFRFRRHKLTYRNGFRVLVVYRDQSRDLGVR